MDWARLLASQGFFLICLLGLLLFAALVLDIQQGLSDEDVLYSYPLSMGPFIALFGLHRAGHSFVLWALLAALALHAAALLAIRRHLSSRTDRRGVMGVPWPRSVTLVSAAMVVLSAGLLAWSGALDRPARVHDSIGLRVRVTDVPEGPTSQVVEEGAVYEVPHADGARTLLFAVSSRGPYALERTHDGLLRAHLPGVSDESSESVISVEARRPAAHATDAPSSPRIYWPRWSGFLCVLLSALAVVIIVSRGAALPSGEWRQFSSVAVSFLALMVFNPAIGPGRARVPLQGGVVGEEVAWSAVLTGSGSVAPWTTLFPVEVRIVTVWWLNLSVVMVAISLVAAILFDQTKRRVLRGPVRGLAWGGALIASLIGIAWLALSVGQVPPFATASELLAVFHAEVLPRIPMDVPVLHAEVTVPGPYHVPWIVGISAALSAFASAFIFAMVALGRSGRTGVSLSTVKVAGVVIVAVTLVRCAQTLAVHAQSGSGALPFSLIALLVAGLSPLVARAHPGWSAGSLATITAAATMQLALVS